MLQYKPIAPYVRNRDTAFAVMMDVVIALLPLYFMAFYFFGLRALLLGLASTAAAVVSDFVCILLEGKRPYLRDISSVVTGMILPLLMSAATPYYVVVSASVFAIVFVKHVFGGVGQSAFNPAAAGFAFAAACWPAQVFSYPVPFAELEPFGSVSATLSNGPAWNLFQGGGTNQRYLGSPAGQVFRAYGTYQYSGAGGLPVLSAVPRSNQLAGSRGFFWNYGSVDAFIPPNSGKRPHVAGV